MYEPDPVQANLMKDEPAIFGHVSAAANHALSGDADVAPIPFCRLRAALVEVLKALRETLPDEHNNASEYLRRAGAMLEAVESHEMPPTGTARGTLAPWQVRRVMAHIDANLDQSIKNRDLAAVVRLSEFYFNVAFRNSVGESPHEYVIRRRMERAQGLMLSTNAPLSQIAAECGLADQAHFTKLFRRIIGETPAAWRRARLNP